MSLSLGLDVGGTKVFGALVDEHGAVAADVSLATDPGRWPDAVLEVIGELLDGTSEPVASAGLAVAAWIEYPSRRFAYAPNLQVTGRDLAREITGQFQFPAILENDANAAAWGEYQFGAGRGHSHMLMVTAGTGIGGGVVFDGKLFRGSRGFAAEFGHVPVEMDGPQCPCGGRGCLEAVASGRALGRMAQEEAEPGGPLLALAGGDRSRITGRLVGEAAVAGDASARRLVARLGRNLGVGLAGLAKAFDPQAIVVGGGVSDLGEMLLEPARMELLARYAGQVDPPEVLKAVLGNRAGAVGVADLARI